MFTNFGSEVFEMWIVLCAVFTAVLAGFILKGARRLIPFGPSM